ncbi:ABC transporter ATP-binding protein [Clostridium oryzae]|uniref:ABC transporter ATP-binding protein YtrB n=1 Tax=Clostridium oryzae TaxID=1450648 RepID=A0A1V4IYK9_9CLOT|nr:ABC transporter ATP-binding protein [Clostridium oryzae]OPJ64900.1 ABC transporter ATP-binding protein YtrB [Clostridium oryzae]
MLEIKNISKSFPGKEAVKNVSFTIDKGNITGLVGPNGAGKSTLIRTIVDIYEPDNGEVLINSQNVRDNSDIKKIIGYVADKNDYFNQSRIKDIIKHYKLAYENFDMDCFNKANEVFKIPLRQKLSKLSKGNISRVFFMLALSIRPEIMILDEPTSGLDPIIKRKFLKMLIDDVYERKTTVLISSHNLADLESICDQVIFMDDGEVIKNNSLDNLKKNMRKLQVIFKDKAPEGFEKWPEFLQIDKIGRSYNIITKDYTEALAEKLKANDVLFVEELDLSLEDMLVYSVESRN